MNVIMSTDEFITEFKKIQPNLSKEVDIVGEYKGMNREILVSTRYGVCSVNARGLLRGNHPTIVKAIDKTAFWISKAEEVHGDRYDYSISTYKGSVKKIDIICKIHGKFSQLPNAHLISNGCGLCVIEKTKKTHEEFMQEFKHKNPELYHSVKVINKYENNLSKIVFMSKYGLCSMRADHILKNKLSIVSAIDKTEYFIKLAEEVHGDVYGYDEVEYISAFDKVKIYCSKHNGYFYQYPQSHLEHGCNVCSSSTGEIRIYDFLTKMDIFFEMEKKFKRCSDIKSLRFDFYIPEYNMCIEYDGQQHYREVFFRGDPNVDTKERLRNIKRRDEIKNNYCEKEGVHLLRIPYWDYDNIENIISESINKLIQL